MGKINKLHCFIVVVALLPLILKAQPGASIRQQLTAISSYNTAHTPEKIFIHTDKQNYNKEDTLWFKAYVFDAATVGATTKSGLMYIEIADANNRVINRNMVMLNAGLGWGSIPLVDHRFPEGTYTLRAYTNWMRNFDEHYIFSRQFTIEGPLDEDWMINSRFELTEKEGMSNVKTDLTFVTNEGRRMFAEELNARITARRRTLYKTTLRTGVDGTLAFDFNLPDKVTAKEINISLTKKRTKQAGEVTYNVPVIVNRDEKTDLQFMPEGGSMIAGMLNNVAFKAINEEGKGVDVNGGIYNNTGQKVADLKSIHLGMGSFALKPESGQTYTARTNYKGKYLSFVLPPAQTSGLIMRVDNQSNKDSIIINVAATVDIQQAKGVYYIVGQARNVVCYGAAVNVAKGSIRIGVHRDAFPTGIARFTLLSQTRQPVAERIVFVNHHDQIKLTIQPSKQSYANRDSVNLNIIAKDKNDKPVKGSFSLAVTDDAQVKMDSMTLYNLPAKVLLADDLKGEIENPGWYFVNAGAVGTAAALDVLLLTQGWVNYNWTDVFAQKQKTLAYKSEPVFAVRGRVSNVFNKGVEKSRIVLLSTNPAFYADTVANQDGEFVFAALPHADTVAFNLQAKNKRGRMFNVGIDVDEFQPPVFTASQRRPIPLYVNIDTGRLNAMRARQQYNEEDAKLTGRQLKEVQIKAKKAVKDSKSLVGPGEADFVIGDDEVKAQGKMTLLDVLKKNLPGFRRSEVFGEIGYSVEGLKAIFIIDGISADYFIPPGTKKGVYMSQLLEYIEAEDVKGVELMNTGKNQLPYTQQYLRSGAVFWEYAFIEITTYSGNGIFMRKVPGAYIYRPPVFASTKEFYSPKYAVEKTDVFTDTRPTLFWAPNVTTDNDGRAKVSFYSADKTATYSVNVQGADMYGLVGVAQRKISVNTAQGK